MGIRSAILRKALRSQFAKHLTGTIAEQRAWQAKSSRFNRLPSDVHCQPVVRHGISGEWIAGPSAGPEVILYLHGGAYTLGSVSTHRHWIARLVKAAGVRGLAIDYRLAPEHPFPAALDDTLGFYQWLLEEGVEPGRILLAGDSAGGGLALAALLRLRDAGMPLPAGAVCLSPWTDLALTGASLDTKAAVDPILNRDMLRANAAHYIGDQPATGPLVSPLYADLTGLPPLLIQVGSDEVLLDDSTRLAERAQAVGVDVTLEIWEEMFHVFPMFPFLPESRKALESILRFTADRFAPAR